MVKLVERKFYTKETSVYENIIKLYVLEHIRTIIDSIETLSGDDLKLEIKLLRVNESCSNCGSILYSIKDYYLTNEDISVSYVKNTFMNQIPSLLLMKEQVYLP